MSAEMKSEQTLQPPESLPERLARSEEEGYESDDTRERPPTEAPYNSAAVTPTNHKRARTLSVSSFSRSCSSTSTSSCTSSKEENVRIVLERYAQTLITQHKEMKFLVEEYRECGAAPCAMLYERSLSEDPIEAGVCGGSGRDEDPAHEPSRGRPLVNLAQLEVKGAGRFLPNTTKCCDVFL
eukprot:762645-Hanusia_phi.AAC.2